MYSFQKKNCSFSHYAQCDNETSLQGKATVWCDELILGEILALDGRLYVTLIL